MAGTITFTPMDSKDKTMTSIVVDFTADASDASFPNDESYRIDGFITNAYFVPGATAPTTGFDVTVEWLGVDLLGGAGADIVTSANALISPANTAGDIQYAGFVGNITPKAINNSVNSATFKLILIVAR